MYSLIIKKLLNFIIIYDRFLMIEKNDIVKNPYFYYIVYFIDFKIF